MTPKKKLTEAEAVKVVTDLQTCQSEVEAAKTARDAAEKALAKAQETFRVTANRYETAVLARDAMIASSLGSA